MLRMQIYFSGKVPRKQAQPVVMPAKIKVYLDSCRKKFNSFLVYVDLFPHAFDPSHIINMICKKTQIYKVCS